ESVHAFSVLERTAHKTFRGYRKLRRLLLPGRNWPEPDLSRDENQILEELNQAQAKTRDALARFRKMPLPFLFRYFPLWLVIFLLAGSAAAVPLLDHFGIRSAVYRDWSIGLCVASALLVVLYFYGRHRAAPAAALIAGELARAQR